MRNSRSIHARTAAQHQHRAHHGLTLRTHACGDGRMPDEHLAAGDFSEWVTGMQAAIRGERDSDVPCNGCTACCRSSHFVQIEPDETGALARIPPELLFAAPRLPPGHVVMGYDERGHCPMLVDDRCSIYEDRPRACRIYDCRIFAAAGVEVDDAEHKTLVTERVVRWRFGYPTPDDEARQRAVRAAAEYLERHGEPGPTRLIPESTTRIAVRAVELYEDFMP